MSAASSALRVSRILQADAETLFRAWTDPDELMHWWCQEGDGWAFAGASVDLRVGGSYRLAMTGPDGRPHVAVGVYREVQRPTRLVFTWDWESPANQVGETLVSIELTPRSGKQTHVVLTHERLPIARMGRHEQGWTELLNLLERRLTMTTRETIQEYFASLEQKAAWPSFLSDDMVFTSFTSPVKRVNGKTAYLESTRRFYSMITGVEPRRLIVDGQQACALTRYQLQPPSGAAFSSDVAEVFEVRDGKIASFDIYFDSAPFPK